MIRQRDFSSLRPLISAICVVYLLATIGTVALSFTLNTAHRSHGGNFQCKMHPPGEVDCGRLGSTTLIQALVWIESLLLLPVICLCILTLWARATVERLPGNTMYAIPCSLILVFVLQIIFLIICLSKGYFRHHWLVEFALLLQSLFALPVAYLFFNLPQINGDSEPPHLRDDRQNMLKVASARDRTKSEPGSNSSRSGPPKKKAPASTEQQPVSVTNTGTGSREEMGEGCGSVTGSKEPMPSAETIPVAPVSDPLGQSSGQSHKSDHTGKTGQTTGGSKPKTPQGEAPPAREIEDSESKKKTAKKAEEAVANSQQSNKTASDRLKHTKIVIPPKSKSKSSRSGA